MDTREILMCIKEVSKIDPMMPLQELHCLLTIAMHDGGTSLSTIAKEVGISLPTASRYIAALGKQDRHRSNGLGLVEAFEDPMERRKKIIRLTPKGKAAINHIKGVKYANLSER